MLGPYSRNLGVTALTKPDLRTREGRLVRDTRNALTQHVGGKPSVTERALIERAVRLTLQVALLDRKASEAGGLMTDHDSRTYLAWSNSLTRTLKQLGMKGAAQQAPTLTDYLASRAA
jgi:hypothetical protein